MNDLEEEAGNQSTTHNPREAGTFKNFLTKFNRRFSRPQAVKVEPEVHEAEPVKKGIADFIAEEIAKKDLQPPEFKSEGSSGFGGTNERVDVGVFQEISSSENPPDGYLIGVGVSNIFSLLDTYPEGTKPKGIVLVNTDPAAVQDSNKFVELLKEGVLIGFDTNDKPRKSLYRNLYAGEFKEKYEESAYYNGENTVDTTLVINKHHDLLVELAKSGNLAVIQQNLFDPELLEILSRLPDLKDSNNVVYLSNVADWIWRPIGRDIYKQKGEYGFVHKAPTPEDYPYVPDMADIFKPYNNLEALKPNPPHTNYYADTLGKKHGGLGYHLRVQPEIPTFSRNDFDLIS